jgi:hypothetical protein
MFRLSAPSRAAAALFAAALVLLAMSCAGGGDNSDDPSPSATSTEAEVTDTPDSGPLSADVIDLAQGAARLTVFGENDSDFPTGSTSLALGDFNGDGEDDLLIGAPQGDGPDESRAEGGEAYIIFGPLEGEIDLAARDADVTIFGALPGDNLGYSVLAGDLNGDGTDDVLVGATGVTAGFDPRTDQGRVYVFYGGANLKEVYDLAEDVFDFTVTGAEGFSRLSHSMDMGDVNGDGAQDLVVGAPFAGREPGSPPGSPRTGLGEVYIIFGSPDIAGEKNIASLHQDVLLSGRQGPPEFGEFGAAVTVADLNGDGTDDIAIGAYRSNPSGERSASGAVYIFYGRSDWPARVTVQNDEQDATIIGPAQGSAIGLPLASGDFDADGTADLAAGGQTETFNGTAVSGAVRIFFGGPGLQGTIDLATEDASVTIPGRHPGNLLPSSLAAADVDGDGDDELLIGAHLSGDDEGRRSAGLVYVIAGRADFPDSINLGGPERGRPLVGAAVDDTLGNVVAGGRSSGGGSVIAVLAAAASAGEERQNAGAVYVVPLTLP